MGKYLKKFSTHDEYNTFTEGNVIFPNVSVCSTQKHVHYTNPNAEYIFIDQNNTDPATRISGDVRGSIIQEIRNNSHIYVGAYNTETNALDCIQMSDSNKTNFVDGTSVIGGVNGNMFMKLPEFWWNCSETEPDSDIWKCGFSMSSVPGWNHWDGKYFIGVHEAKASQQNETNNATSSNNALNDYDTTLSDVPGYTGYSSGNIPQDVFRQMARNLGSGFTITTWNVHCMMALLFYAYYGNTNSQAICGTGSNSYNRATGQCDALGMTDTTSSTSSVSTNFWGLENWWGDKFEWLDNVYVTTDGSQTIVNIYNEDETLNRSIACGEVPAEELAKAADNWGEATSNNITCWNTAILGKSFDLIPNGTKCVYNSEDDELNDGGNSTTGYCDYMYVHGENTTYTITDKNNTVHSATHPGLIGGCSSVHADGYGGVAYCVLCDTPVGTFVDSGARIQYHGDYVIHDNVEGALIKELIN